MEAAQANLDPNADRHFEFGKCLFWLIKKAGTYPGTQNREVS